ncbi:SDR family NAD(P)-dependent oxidoreductase [Thiohalocapsa marina]|nr:SDR family oxidoreductase [Thiohalocapsa marina]
MDRHELGHTDCLLDENPRMSKNHLIIGASSGVGAALCRELSARNHTVVHASRQPDTAALGAKAVTWDARDDAFPTDELPETLDGLVYCPGSIRLKPFGRMKPEEFRDDFELNLVGAVKAIQAALPALARSESASVLLFSTVAVQTGMPYHASVAAAKGAVEGLTRSLAAEFAPRIRVNAIAPTLTDTPLAARLLGSEEKRRAAAERHPLKRVIAPEETARTALWLLEDAPSVTGQIIRLDAGIGSLHLL